MIAVIYFYFRSPADVKFFSDIFFTAEDDRTSGLMSIAGVNRPCFRGDDRRFSRDFGKLGANIERTLSPYYKLVRSFGLSVLLLL
ncbi:hypothetical protein QUB63_01300 [Microcoleus sp. ARI1-B5]